MRLRGVRTSRAASAALIVSIKITAIAIAVAVTILLIYGVGFPWYVALAVGVLGYVAAKGLIAVVVGYFWGQRDAREMKQWFEGLPPEVKQDVIDNAPPDVSGHVADVLKK